GPHHAPAPPPPDPPRQPSSACRRTGTPSAPRAWWSPTPGPRHGWPPPASTARRPPSTWHRACCPRSPPNSCAPSCCESPPRAHPRRGRGAARTRAMQRVSHRPSTVRAGKPPGERVYCSLVAGSGPHMVVVAQLVELLVVVQAVAGSNPVDHPRCARCELSTVEPVGVRTSLSFRASSAQASALVCSSRSVSASNGVAYPTFTSLSSSM